MPVICDLYANNLLSMPMMPVFHGYYHVEFKEGYSMQSHLHSRVEIMYARKGSCEVFAAENRYRLEAGDFILVNGGVLHKLRVDRHTPCRVLCLEFHFEHDEEGNSVFGPLYQSIGEMRLFFKEAPQVLKLKDTMEAYTHLVDIFRELEHVQPGRNLSIRYAFSQFMIKLSRLHAEHRQNLQSPQDSYIREAVAFIANHYHEEIGVEEIAEQLKLNVSYFHKIFKKSTGSTPLEHLNQVRINKAKMLLENTDIPIIEICSFVGFNSRQYFTQAFKKNTGMTPRAFKQKQQAAKGPAWRVNPCAESLDARSCEG